jgi:hypothetical protein
MSAGSNWKDEMSKSLDFLETLLSPKVVGALALMAVIAILQHPWVNAQTVALATRLGNPPVAYDTQVGATTRVDLTVVTADYRRLTCASDEVFDGNHCAYHADKKQRFPRGEGGVLDDNGAHIIQPYRTAANNMLILVAGVWATPEVADRLHREPPDLPVKEQTRFTAWCEVEILAHPKQVSLRWDTGKAWYDETNYVVVAKAKSCTIERPSDER